MSAHPFQRNGTPDSEKRPVCFRPHSGIGLTGFLCPLIALRQPTNHVPAVGHQNDALTRKLIMDVCCELKRVDCCLELALVVGPVLNRAGVVRETLSIANSNPCPTCRSGILYGAAISEQQYQQNCPS